MLRIALGGLISLVIAMGVGRFAFTPILPSMQAEAGLAVDAAGLVASLNFAGYLIGALVMAVVPQGAMRTTVFRVSLVASVVSTMAMGLGDSMLLWGAMRFVSGVASAGVFILGSAIVLDALARSGREGLAGWHYGGVGVGIALSGLFVEISGASVGWRGEWFGLGIVCAVLAAIPCLTVVDAPRPAEPKGAARPARVAPPLPLVLLTLAYILQGAGYIITGTFLVAILKSLPDTAAVGNVAWIVAGLAATPSSLIWATAGRRFGSWRALIVANGVQAVGILLPLAGAGAIGGVLSAVLFGGTFIGIVGQTIALGRQLLAGASGQVIAVLTVGYGLGQILGPLPAGIAVEMTGSYAVALVGAAAMVMTGLALLVAGSVLDAARRRRCAGSPVVDRLAP